MGRDKAALFMFATEMISLSTLHGDRGEWNMSECGMLTRQAEGVQKSNVLAIQTEVCFCGRRRLLLSFQDHFFNQYNWKWPTYIVVMLQRSYSHLLELPAQLSSTTSSASMFGIYRSFTTAVLSSISYIRLTTPQGRRGTPA